jgi:hypothetical protein
MTQPAAPVTFALASQSAVQRPRGVRLGCRRHRRRRYPPRARRLAGRRTATRHQPGRTQRGRSWLRRRREKQESTSWTAPTGFASRWHASGASGIAGSRPMKANPSHRPETIPNSRGRASAKSVGFPVLPVSYATGFAVATGPSAVSSCWANRACSPGCFATRTVWQPRGVRMTMSILASCSCICSSCRRFSRSGSRSPGGCAARSGCGSGWLTLTGTTASTVDRAGRHRSARSRRWRLKGSERGISSWSAAAAETIRAGWHDRLDSDRRPAADPR